MSQKTDTHNAALVRLATMPELIEGRLEEALEVIAAESLNFLNVERISIWRVSRQVDRLTCLKAVHRVDSRRANIPTLDISHTRQFKTLVKEGKIVDVEEISVDPRTAELNPIYWSVVDIQAVLIAPIQFHGRVDSIAIFEHSGAPRKWTKDEILFATKIANLIAIAFRNDEARMSAEQLSALNATLMDLTAEKNLPTLLNTIVERSAKLTNAAGGLVYLSDADRKQVRCVVSYQTPNDYTDNVLEYGIGAAGKVAQTGEPLNIEDYPSWPNRAELYREEPVSAVLSAPMTWKNRVTGVIQVFQREENMRFNDRELDLLMQFAKQAAIAVENARLYAETNRRASYQEVLYDIVSAANASKDVDALLRTTLERTLKALQLEMGIGDLDDHTIVKKLPVKAGGLIARALQNVSVDFMTTRAVNDWRLTTTGMSVVASEMERFGIRASLIAPLFLNSKRVGFLCFADNRPHQWDLDEITLVETIGHQISSALERRRNMEEMREWAETMSSLASATEDLNRVLHFKEVINVIGEGAMALAKTYRAAIFLRQVDGRFDVPWFKGLTHAYLRYVTTQENESLTSHILANNSVVFLTDRPHPREDKTLRSFLKADTFRAITLWPLVYDERVVAVIGCYYDTPREWMQNERDLMHAFCRQAAASLENAWLYEQLEENYINTALTLAKEIDAREVSGTDHSQRLAVWAEATARELELSSEELAVIHWAAMMHDIGKAVVPDQVLQKVGPLNDEEWEIIHRYPIESEKITQPITRLPAVANLVRHVRERYDGSGYPDGISGEDIPLGARILAVADAYNSITDNRPYRRPRPHSEAITELRRCSGNQFDPKVVEAFLRVASNYPLSSTPQN